MKLLGQLEHNWSESPLDSPLQNLRFFFNRKSIWETKCPNVRSNVSKMPFSVFVHELFILQPILMKCFLYVNNKLSLKAITVSKI